MPFQLKRKRVCDAEFLSLPPRVRESFIVAFRELALSRTPLIRGEGWFVEELRQRQRIAREGLFSLHVVDPRDRRWRWRGLFFRRGDALVFFGFGPSDQEFYSRMGRVRVSLRRQTDEE